MTAPDRDWLCAVALCEYGWASTEELAAASLAWLPTAPDSEALYHLADHALRETTRGPDVWAWVDEVFDDLGCPKPAREDLRWIAIRSMIGRALSSEDAERLTRFLSWMAFEAHMERRDDEWNLLSKYRFYDFEMEDGVTLDWNRVLLEFRRETEPVLLERFNQHFASSVNARWILDLFGRVPASTMRMEA